MEGIPGVAGKDLHRHRTAVCGTEQSVGDLLLARLAVTVVAEGRQGAAPSLQKRTGNIVQNKSIAAPEVAVGEALLDPGLALQQPVEHGQHLVAGDGAEIEHGPEAGGCGLRRQRPGGGELGGGIDDARDDGGDGEIPHAVRLAAEDADQADPAQGAEDGGDMAVGPGPADGEDVLGAGDGDAALEQGLDPLDDVGRELSEVGERLLLEASVLSPSLSDEDCWPALAVWDGFVMEGHGTRLSCVCGLHWHKIGRFVNLHVTSIPKSASAGVQKTTLNQRLVDV